MVFKRDGGKLIFVKAELGTTKLLRLTVPAKLEASLAVRRGARCRRASACACSPRSLGKRFTTHAARR